MCTFGHPQGFCLGLSCSGSPGNEHKRLEHYIRGSDSMFEVVSAAVEDDGGRTISKNDDDTQRKGRTARLSYKWFVSAYGGVPVSARS